MYLQAEPGSAPGLVVSLFDVGSKRIHGRDDPLPVDPGNHHPRHDLIRLHSVNVRVMSEKANKKSSIGVFQATRTPRVGGVVVAHDRSECLGEPMESTAEFGSQGRISLRLADPYTQIS